MKILSKKSMKIIIKSPDWSLWGFPAPEFIQESIWHNLEKCHCVKKSFWR